MERVLTVLCYGVLLALTLGAAAVPALLVGAWRRRPFSGKIFLVTLGLMAGYAAWVPREPGETGDSGGAGGAHTVLRRLLFPAASPPGPLHHSPGV